MLSARITAAICRRVVRPMFGVCAGGTSSSWLLRQVDVTLLAYGRAPHRLTQRRVPHEELSKN
jgi:hypothetical protein